MTTKKQKQKQQQWQWQRQRQRQISADDSGNMILRQSWKGAKDAD
jgi:hypothetical protein